jgi:hypothetical protein
MGAGPSSASLKSQEGLNRAERSVYFSLKRELRAVRIRKAVHKLLAVLAAVDGVGTLEEEGLYHPDILREALRLAGLNCGPLN